MLYLAPLSVGLIFMPVSSESQTGALPPGLKALFRAGRGKKVFLPERRGFLFAHGSSPQGLLAVFHHVELAHVGVLAARELRTWRI